MANCHSLFLEFDNKIKLSGKKKEQLRNSRNSLRGKIRTAIQDNNTKLIVKFKGQGSYMMSTIIMPRSGEYDLDDGVYFLGKEEDKPAISDVQQWVFDAVKNHTQKPAEKKESCIRVLFTDDHHIDLPIYFKKESGNQFFDKLNTPELAQKVNGWVESDPYAFILWFQEHSKNNKQIRRLIRYIKMWCDNVSGKKNIISGIAVTILVVENIYNSGQDDIALQSTLKNILNKIDDRPGKYGTFQCIRPTPKTFENILANYTNDQKKELLEKLENFTNVAEQAVNHPNQKEACKKWKLYLGEKFNCSAAKDEDEEAKSHSKPAIITSDYKSAKKIQ